MNAMPQRSAVFQDEVPNLNPSDLKISSLPTRGARVRVASQSSRWTTQLEKRFDELTALPRGWDGYAGRPVSFWCAHFAANLMERLFVDGVPAPQLVPGGDGTLQLEWHRNQFDVEIDVLAPCDVLAVRRNHVTGQVEELELQTDFTALSEWIADLEVGRENFQRVKA
jgi:hypothetical protein